MHFVIKYSSKKENHQTSKMASSEKKTSINRQTLYNNQGMFVNDTSLMCVWGTY